MDKDVNNGEKKEVIEGEDWDSTDISDMEINDEDEHHDPGDEHHDPGDEHK